MKKPLFFVFFVLTGILITGTAMAEKLYQKVDIPYEKFVLDNGLTLIVHTDRKAPIVAVNVWYHVGSKNEKPGKTGFAHLFEHLMFNGSEHFNDDYFQALERVGATDLNGTTGSDRTNYFQNVPTSAVNVALWMESDRMGHLLGAIDQAKLDEQRGVVQNEKRQYENEPYGMVDELITKSVYPEGHPYSWTVIGSMEDLDNASLEDVREWFKTYYGAANAVIAVAGDIDAKTAKEKVKKYFGNIPSGPPIARHQKWIAKRTGTQRETVQDRVPQARIYKVWNVPEWGAKENIHLNLLSDVLSDGKTSRLYKRLVYDDQIATNVSSYLYSREISGLFFIEATAKPGEDLSRIERAIDEELDTLLQQGPTQKEVERVRTQYLARFVRGIERIGGFGGKSDILARNQVYADDPAFYKTTLKWITTATAQDLHNAGKAWLTDGQYVLQVKPYPSFSTISTEVDRSKVPEPGDIPEAEFPKFEERTLDNGLKVILAKRSAVPLVKFSMLFNAGFAADQHAIPGTAKLAMAMLDEGTKTRTSLEINEQLSMLGANLSTSSNLDMSSVNLSTLTDKMNESLEIFADVILNPVFPKADFDRLVRQQLAAIQREKVTPIQMALRVFPELLYGENHAYGNPLTGSGTEESVKKIDRQALIDFHKTWIRPNNATLVVVGATSWDEIIPKLTDLLAHWQQNNVPDINLAKVSHQSGPKVYLVNRPGSMQSIIFAGHVAPPTNNPNEIAIETMNNLLGGSFTSRINMNLREDKHWTYGARSLLWGARGQRPFITYTSVQSDKTLESMQEIRAEISGILDEKPVTKDELLKAQKNQTLELAGSWETLRDVEQSIAQIVRYNLTDDYFQTYADRVLSLTTEDIAQAAAKVLEPQKLVWVVVGDREKIESELSTFTEKEITLIDSDGEIVE